MSPTGGQNESSRQITNQSSAMTASLSVLPQASESPSDSVLLATAVVLIKNRAGSFVPCRALLDSGSQLHFITTRFASQLHLLKTKSSVTVSGIGDAYFSTEGYSVDLVLKSRTSVFATSITAVVVQTITDNQPGCFVSTSGWNIPSNIQLADPGFHLSERIDLLIGAGLFFDLLCVGQIRLQSGFPLLQKTLLGWVLSGGGQRAPKLSSFIARQKLSTSTCIDATLDDLVRRFWEIEHNFEPISKTTQEDIDCEEHFRENYSRLPSGEYSVRLPLKRNPKVLGDSYLRSRQRFESLERKFARNADLKTEYSKFIKEYLDLNHMSLVSGDNFHYCKYFLPHHCVIKDNSSTTKLRVVFDSSASTTSGFSLNDLLMAGPTIQTKFFNILIRFRTFPIALTGDICKMYRCVRVTPPNNMLQCILWRESPFEKLQTYKLNTVTYGTKPAAFLSIRAMHQLATDEFSAYPIGSKILLRDFYVDDMISGGDSLEEVRDIKLQTTSLLAQGNFKLRKWCSNSPDIISEIPDEDKERFMKFDDGSHTTKTLGLIWDPIKNNLLFSYIPQQEVGKKSKRSALSTLARCYDPLGLMGPTLTRAKILLQRMWRDKLAWDESLPQSLDAAWSEFCSGFAEMQHLSFPRYVLQPEATTEIHAFCDASLEAYEACVYIRSIKDDICQVHVLCSKAWVAPLKTITVPKFELCAATLLSQLVDSSTVLSWLREESSKFNVFVANRISTIHQLTEGMQWHYVPTAMNPADILSKGATPKELLNSKLWMHGPPFLQKTESSWPRMCASQSKLPELRQKALLVENNRIDISLSFKYINSFATMQRIFGYVSKFLYFKQTARSSHLTASDVRKGTQLLVRIVQRAQLWPEYTALQANKCVSTSSNIISLSPFLDEFGVIRVGGRLKNSMLSFESRHPCILPKDHPLTNAIITYFHPNITTQVRKPCLPSFVCNSGL